VRHVLGRGVPGLCRNLLLRRKQTWHFRPHLNFTISQFNSIMYFELYTPIYSSVAVTFWKTIGLWRSSQNNTPYQRLRSKHYGIKVQLQFIVNFRKKGVTEINLLLIHWMLGITKIAYCATQHYIINACGGTRGRQRKTKLKQLTLW